PGYDPQWEMTHSGRPARVFLDSRVRIFHRGSYDYGIEDAGIVVPRIQQLETTMTASRKEARDILINALDLPVDVKLDMQEYPEPWRSPRARRSWRPWRWPRRSQCRDVRSQLGTLAGRS